MIVKQGRNPRIIPWDMSDVDRDSEGILRYTNLPESLVAMLRSTVDRVPDGEALVELGGERVSYRELWDRSARVAGGLRAAPGWSGATGWPSTSRTRNDWAYAFFGVQMAGAVAVPVNTLFSETEVEYVVTDSGRPLRIRNWRTAAAEGEPHVVDDLGHKDLAAIFYTSGTTGFPKGP